MFALISYNPLILESIDAIRAAMVNLETMIKMLMTHHSKVMSEQMSDRDMSTKMYEI